MIMRFLESFDHLSSSQKLFASFGCIGLLGVVDFLTGYEVAFAVFYVFPIAVLAWNQGLKTAGVASILSACIWIGADVASGHEYSHPLIPLWNTIIRLTFFLIIVFLIVELRHILNREKAWARTDSLTGAINARLFFDLIRAQMNRTQRFGESFSVAYIDLDNFKNINDRFGHSIGDRVLQTVVKTINAAIREMDVLARLGGDEFALLLPDTDERAARIAIGKVRNEILKIMRLNRWPVSLSVGVISCPDTPRSVDEVMKQADMLMYKVKRNKKDGAEFATYRRQAALTSLNE